ncbi:unnamed protein product [Schistosoma mattheei]|uniref:Uncharacterized protein n=1 Tax=Schistosoma mattheei TaxID=31246 RepID=A0AA85BMN4_9TREM|nr:unnamed protein product [Schistosoma mattheei]
MDETELRPNLGRFVDIINRPVCESVTVEDLKPNGVYQPPHLTPVFFEESKKKPSIERAKLRAARFILEDTDLNESEDLPKEVYKKRIERSLLPSGLSDTSSRLRQMQILLQSSDEELEYKPPQQR